MGGHGSALVTGEGWKGILTSLENSRKSIHQDQNSPLPPINENSVGTTQKKKKVIKKNEKKNIKNLHLKLRKKLRKKSNVQNLF